MYAVKIQYFLLLFLSFTLAKGLNEVRKDSGKVHLSAWNEQKIILSIGGGYPNYEKNYLQSNSISPTSTITSVKGAGPFHLKMEYALGNHFGFGISVNYSNVKYTSFEKTTSYYQTKIDTAYCYAYFFNFNFRINYHPLHDKIIDPYVGLGLGMKKYKIRYGQTGFSDYTGTSNIENYGLPFGFELTLGLRIFVTKRIGAYIEAGASRSLVQGGLCFNIGRN